MWNLAGACVCIRRRRRCACSSVKFWAKIARARMCSRACWQRTVKDAQPTWFEHGGTIVKPSGVVMGPTVVACERKGTGEPTLLRGLRPVLKPGDILLVDALLAAWWIIAEARAAGVDIVMPQHGRRLTDCTRCQSLGKKAPLVSGSLAAASASERDERRGLRTISGRDGHAYIQTPRANVQGEKVTV